MVENKIKELASIFGKDLEEPFIFVDGEQKLYQAKFMENGILTIIYLKEDGSVGNMPYSLYIFNLLTGEARILNEEDIEHLSKVYYILSDYNKDVLKDYLTKRYK